MAVSAGAIAQGTPAAGLVSARGTAVLSVGTLASGILAYAFNVLAARSLGPAAYGPIAALWAVVFLAAVVLFRPLEQTLSRSIAERGARDVDSHVVLHSVGRLATFVCTTAVGACLLAWEPITNGLFSGQDGLTAAMAAAIVAYCGSYFVRGAVGGVRWFGGYGLLLFTDGAVRLLVALPLVFLASPTIAAIAVVLAALGGAVAPLLPRHRDLRAALAGANDETFDMRAALRFAAPMTVVAACEQLLVSGGPILVMLTGGEGAAAAAGVVFAATMLVRAPVFLFQGLSAALLPSLTRLDALGDQTRFRTAVVGTAAVLGAFSAALVLGAVAAGPQTMHLLYGSGFAVGRLDLSILCAGIGCYLLAATLSQAMLARGRAATAAAVWASGGALFVALELLLSGSPMHRVSVSFAAASTLMAVLFAALAVRRREPSGHTIAIPARGARSLAGTRGYGR